MSELVGTDSEDVRLIQQKMDKAMARNKSAKTAVDIALWDLLGEKAGLPVVKLLGSAKLGGETDIAIGIMSVERRAAENIKKGLRALKIEAAWTLKKMRSA